MSNSKFYHEEIYRGKDLTKKLAEKIVVAGCGAIGSNLIDSLVRQGFSNIRVVDKDRVETHNINTQIFTESDVGAYKVNAIQQKAFESVGVELEILPTVLSDSNIKKAFRDVKLIVDAFDNSASRRLIQNFARASKIPCLHGGVIQDYGEVVWDEIYKVPDDGGKDICDYPLARNLVTMVVGIACEELVDFFLQKTPRKQSWALTLKDFKIRPYV